jgi:hypothetical protein
MRLFAFFVNFENQLPISPFFSWASTGLSLRENFEKKPDFFSFSEVEPNIEAWSGLDLTFAFGPSRSFTYERADCALVFSSGNGSEVVDMFGRVVVEVVPNKGARTEGDFGAGGCFLGDGLEGETGGEAAALTGVGGGDTDSTIGDAASSGGAAFFFFLGFFFFFFLPALRIASSSSTSSTVAF